MTGETQNAYPIKESDTGSKEQDKRVLLDQFSERTRKENREHYRSGGLLISGTKFAAKEKEYSQREAIIRPQQTGKIDFKSLQNRPKFSSDERTWPSNKGCPHSPTGKKTREKGKKSGKSERSNPQQLYRLSITNHRSKPAIGIAYPQQKVTPPKKLEASRGPISGSYRFHVPSIPEREAELQQQELSYSRCIQEASSSFTSTNYTSQPASTTGSASVQHHPATTQQLGLLQNSSSSSTQPGGQLLQPEFQVNGTNSWQPTEKTFSGVNYGGSSHKLSIFTEGNKSSPSFVPLPFQYEYSSLQESATDPYPCDQSSHPQDYIDISVAATQMSQSPFIHSSGDGQEESQSNSQTDVEQPEGRTAYPQPLQHAQFLHSPHGPQPSLHCYKGRNEHTSDNESLISSSNQLEQKNSCLNDNPTTFRDNTGVTLVSVSKSVCPPKDTVQRILAEGNSHHARNLQNLDSQMELTNKAYNSSLVNTMHMGTVPFEKSIPCITNKNVSKLSQTWEGDKVSSSFDHNSLSLHANPNDKNQFNCQPTVEQKLHGPKNRKMPWQQIHLTSVMPKQNRIELSRQLSNQKLTFLAAPSDWQDVNEPHRNGSLNSPDSFHSKTPDESFTNHQESIKQNCNNTSVFPYDANAEVTTSQVPPVGLSPCESPLQNATSGSTCSSLSPTSNSPVISSEDTQLPTRGPPPPFYQQHQGKILTPSDHLNSDFQHFHTNLSRTFLNTSERVKEDALSSLHNIKYRSTMDSVKSCMHSIPVEHKPPPSYSAHQLLASSLATANLDQLDVLLTCKQCDQNFNNLASFLDHKQYCGNHTLTHKNEFKNEPKMEDSRKCQTDSAKTTGTTFTLSKYPSDLHLSLLGLNKNGELMSDSEIKGEPKDDSSKPNVFNVTSNLPIPIPDLEMDDAKLDSLITEALNGLGYQSDNAEIDSSFIDAFADDELTTAKVTGSVQVVKTKDCMMYDSRSKHLDVDDDRSQSQGKCLQELDRDSLNTKNKNKTSILEKVQQESFIDSELKEKAYVNQLTPRCKLRDASPEKSFEQFGIRKEGRHSTDSSAEASKEDARFFLSSRFTERSTVKTFQESYSSVKSSVPRVSCSTRNSGKTGVKDSKRKKAGGGTWSKELIHKIVQQKNKLHKLHAKATKNQQFSLIMEKLTPSAQDPKFEEYDYVSDSDEDCRPLKMVSRGRLGHSRRYKYTYSKEYKGGERSSKSKSIPWNCESNESLEVKVTEDISPSTTKQISSCRVRRRRSSRSSTSSEHSTPTSISCESVYSPKNTDRTDSDSEKGLAMKKISSSNVVLMDYYVHDVYETSTVETCKEPNKTSSQLFSRNTKRYGSAKFLLSANLNSCRIGMEKKSELNNTINGNKSFKRYNSIGVSSQGKEQHCSTDLTGMAQSTEQCSNLLKDRVFNDSFKSLVSDSSTSGPHSKLLAVEVMPDTNQTSRTQKNDIFDAEKSEYKSSGGKFSNINTDLLPNAENPEVRRKEEPERFNCHLENKSTILSTPPMERLHRHPPEMQDLALHKEIARSGPTEPDQSLVKSPLQFDTSSLFGEITAAGFDSSLYTDISVNNEGFNSFGTRSEKKELFDPAFSSYLRNKDWSLMTDVTSILRDEGPQFKDLFEKGITKKTNSGLQMTLPDKILDYDTNPTSTVSEDELEIKKIVSELESKLQTEKQNSSSSTSEVSKHLTNNKSSSLQLDHEAGNNQSGTSVHKTVECAKMVTADTNLVDTYIDTDPSWSSPFNFGLLEGQHCVHTPIHDHSGAKDPSSATTGGDVQSPLKQITEDAEVLNKSFAEKSDELLDSEMYTENLMKCLEVISDTVLKKPCLTGELEDSHFSEFLNPEQPCKDNTAVREHHNEIHFTQINDAGNQKPPKHDAMLFQFENSMCLLDSKCELSPNQRDTTGGVTVFELASKECKNIMFQENLSDTKKSQIDINEKESELNEFQFIEEKIKEKNVIYGASEKLQSEEYEQILKSKEPISQKQLRSPNKHNEKEHIEGGHNTILRISHSLPVSIASEDRKNNPKILKYTEETPKTSDNQPKTLISPSCQEITLGSAGHDITVYDLLENDPHDKIKETVVHEDLQKVLPSHSEDSVLPGCELTVSKMKHMDSERPLLTAAELGSTLAKIQLIDCAFENNSKSEVISEFGDNPQQVPSNEMMTSVHAECRENILSIEENGTSCENALPSFTPQNSLLHSVTDPGELNKCQSKRLWNNLETLSLARNNHEINKNEKQLIKSTVTPNSGVPELLIVDLEMAEKKNSGPDCEASIPSDLSLLSTYEQHDCLINNEQTLKADLPNEQKRNQETLYKSKETPLDFKEMPELSHHLEECNDISTGLHESTKVQNVLKTCLKDIPDQWQLGAAMPLTFSTSINSVNTVQMDKNSSATTTEICSLDPALQNSSTQNNSKCSCSTPCCPCGKQRCTSPIMNVVLELSSKVPHDADLCHSAFETIDYTDLHSSLFKKTEVENLDLNMHLSESDESSQRQSPSTDQETFQTSSVCPEEASGLSRHTKSFKLKGGTCKGIKAYAKRFYSDSENQNVASKVIKNEKACRQGAILCEICSACFRTLPGLKRHKAMKHVTKKDGSTGLESLNTNYQESVPIYKKTLFVETGSGDDPVGLEYKGCLQMKNKENRNKLSSEANAPFYRFSKEEIQLSCEGTNTTRLMILEDKEKQRVLPSMARISKSCEVQKNRKVDTNKSLLSKDINPEQFSDDLLNILKTDILQAITPNFFTPPQQSCSKQHKNQDENEKTPKDLKFKANAETNTTSVDSCQYKGCVVIKENETVTNEESRTEPLRMIDGGETENNEICSSTRSNFPGIKETIDPKVIYAEKSVSTETFGEGPDEIKCEKNSCLTEAIDSHCFCFKDSSPSTVQPTLGLEALLDDENNFSQLFPRDEAIIRKKCTRVYGKRNKKQQINPILPVPEAHPASSVSLDNEKHSETQGSTEIMIHVEDSCKYETISMDHAIMLDMCHKSTLKNEFDKMVYKADRLEGHKSSVLEDSEGLGIQGFSSPTNLTNCKAAINWGTSDVLTETVLSSDTQIALKSEHPVSNCPKKFSDPANPISSEIQDISNFHDIDIQNLNTKFQLPEMSLYEPSKNLPLDVQITNEDMEVSDDMKSTKKPTERRGRKRIEGGLKLRDKQYKCKVCFTWFLTLGELNFHKLSHNPSPPPTCYMCVQRKFSSREQLRDHLREKHAKNKAGIWTCGMCLKEISDVWMYNEHLREHATQFARKGQTQSSILGLPGCFMQETAVKNFITSIMQHRPTKCSKGEKGKILSKDAGKAIKENVEQKSKTKDVHEAEDVKTDGQSEDDGKQTTPSQPKVVNKAEGTQRSIEMHPNCKDPSRDCHHCGKQFPKPFKLQRHLVVHSLQKIFLCHRCPIFYQDAKELKDHLKSVHKEIEEQDPKHTTLYTCELCADVMHVIKKSFICSTCNYTFSKKEQFDRHMEKHLTEGNQIFKFRGVLRPNKLSTCYSNDEEFDFLPNKRRKIAVENHLDASFESISALQFSESAEGEVQKSVVTPTSDLFTSNSFSEHKDTSIKTEDRVDDFPEILPSFQKSPLFVTSDSRSLFPSVEKSQMSGFSCPSEEASTMETCSIEEQCATSPSENKINAKDVTCSQTEKEAIMLSAKDQHENQPSLKDCSTTQEYSESSTSAKQPLSKDLSLINKVDLFQTSGCTNVTCTPEGATSATESPVIQTKGPDHVANVTNSPETVKVFNSTTAERTSPAGCPKDLFVDTCTNLISEASNLVKVDSHNCREIKQKSADYVTDQTGVGNIKHHSSDIQKTESQQKVPKPQSNTEQGDSLAKDKVLLKLSERAKQESDSSLKPVAESMAQIKQKKRKEIKEHQNCKMSTTATRENFDVDMRNTKKLRVQSSNKNESTGNHKKGDAGNDCPVLSSVRDDLATNKIIPRQKTEGLNSQTKKNLFNSRLLKKAENVQQLNRDLNRDHKGKKGVIGRHLQLPSSKTSVSSVNSSLSKCRSLTGMRPLESHTFRTAESQNHLLNQLFGQKLTSFKIPLRKDTSESLN
ncbi:uncharacterized protein znf469 isoform X2 [Scleropages formosus]|uniref:uncharacterized protein znf469 isoform X2 n=1 Tax=Scleropages formosus TaxID=113540 RepID=UPI0008791C81|nr:zinc finger protein 469 isoform X2 [Scleropages formosus]